MAQTCFCRRGGLGPISLSLFQGIRFCAAVAGISFSRMVALLCNQNGTTMPDQLTRRFPVATGFVHIEGVRDLKIFF